MLNEDTDEEDSALYKHKTQPKLRGSARGSFQSRSMYMSYYFYCLDILYLCRCFVTTAYSHSDLSNNCCRIHDNCWTIGLVLGYIVTTTDYATMDCCVKK